MKQNSLKQYVIIFLLIIAIVFLVVCFKLFQRHEGYINDKLILIYMPVSDLETCGGCSVLFYLAALLKKKNMNVKISKPSFHESDLNNPIFAEFVDTFDPDNTIVIYPEITDDNPLNAKNVVRWLLQDSSQREHDKWNKDDLCYYYLSEKKIKDSPEKVGSIYKMLTAIYLKPNTFVNLNKSRKGYCHVFKKGPQYHKNLVPFHPEDSVLLEYSNYGELVEKFNQYEYFICYDPVSFLIFLAGLCGCVPILHKVENVSKEEYFTGRADANSSFYLYYLTHPYTNYPGIAYGMEEKEYAKDTLHLLPDLLNKQIEYTNNYCINNFIQDMRDFSGNKNTVETNHLI
jgi:hypothetical protein